MKNMTRFEALNQAFGIYRTQEAMALALEVSQPTIGRWLNQSKQLPAEYVLKVEADTGVSRHDLRPDIYPRETMVDCGFASRFVGTDTRSGLERGVA